MVATTTNREAVVHYVVSDEDSVRTRARRSAEFIRKPNVLASAALVELCEWPCMEALRQDMTNCQCSLGVRQYIEHRRSVPIGTGLTITACCDTDTGRYSEWTVVVDNDMNGECVGIGCFSFVIVDQTAFERGHGLASTAPEEPGGSSASARTRLGVLTAMPGMQRRAS